MIKYSGKIFQVHQEESIVDGEKFTFDTVLKNKVVAIIAMDENNNIYLVRQYRPGADEKLLEIPAGIIDDCETSLSAAQRELKEEVGATSNHWEFISCFYSSPGFTNEQVYLYLARDIELGEDNQDPDERIAVFKISLEEFINYTASDAKTKIASLEMALKHSDYREF